MIKGLRIADATCLNRRTGIRRPLTCAALLMLASTVSPNLLAATASEPNQCLLQPHYYDYRDNSPRTLNWKKKVLGAHFTKSVQRGRAGNGGSLIGELEYVLKQFPNHPKALFMMANEQQKPGFKRSKPMRVDYYYDTVDCFFQRALTVAPDDPAVYLVRAIVLHRAKNYTAAEQDYLKALSFNPDHTEAHYNLGLLYLDKKLFDKAKEHADRAYELGYPLNGLRRKLAAAGRY